MSGQAIAFGRADLTNCDREQIHIPGSVQPHGAVLVLEPISLRVLRAGGDTAGLLGADAAALLGKSLADRIAPAAGEKLSLLSLADKRLTRPHHIFSFGREERLVDALAHVSGAALVLELEPHPEMSAATKASIPNVVHRKCINRFLR